MLQFNRRNLPLNTSKLLLFVSLFTLGYAAVPAFRLNVNTPPADQLPVKHEVVIPRVTVLSDAGEDLKVVLMSTSYNFTLILKKNNYLIPRGFKSYYFDREGRETYTKGHVNCFYQGFVEGHRPEWKAAISTCHGLKGEFGDFNDPTQHYHLKPLNSGMNANTMEQPHILFVDTEMKVEPGSCGMNHTHFKVQADDIVHVGRVRRQTCQQKIVELVVVNDFAQYDSFNRDLSATVMRALAVTNVADTLFQSLDIRIVLVATMTWTNGDQITVSSNAETTLNNFRDYKPQITATHDAAMLLSGVDITGNQVGIAFTGAMCSESNAALIVQDGGTKLDSLVGVVTAHELGHSFNMLHDDQCPDCNDASGSCIMATVTGVPSPSMWSTCSINELNDGFDRLNLDRCLCNQPEMTVGDPVCGNGIREGDEVCDCGSPSECNDPCCNPMTCQLAAGAECSDGECCTSSCTLMAYGTTCRASNGDCDITEYCTGDSNECPTDEHVLDGTPCDNNGGYCYSGSCPSHDQQCRAAFGSDRAADICYSSGNTRGDQFGNCGSTSTSFVACTSSNVLCGQLQCMGGDFQLSGFDVAITIGTLTFNVNGRTEPCGSFTTQPGTDIVSPGLVLDGTRCGDGRVCLSHRCEPVSVLTSGMSCEVGTNGEVCSGNGECNNRGGCSCKVGYTGSVCETEVGDGMVNCDSDNGGCEHTCTVVGGTMIECSCRDGYVLASDGMNCNDVDECNSNNGGCSQICTNTAGSFQCSCRSGYTLSIDGRTCNDINECSSNNGGCSQICTNTAGSFQCSCRSGYTLSIDGRTCNDINECNSNNGGCFQICTNTAGSFQCSCRSGYTLSIDGRTCNDIDECATNNGGCSQTCTNIDGSFQCSCRNGFDLGSDGISCTDIDECSTNSDNCEQRCINTEGSFTCGCNSGLTLNSDGRTCADIMECSTNNGGCDHICTESEGSFQCSCRSGFELGSDGRSCTDIDECSTNSDNCEQRCINTEGSFTCGCNSGLILNSDGRTCADIMECSTNNGGCDHICTESEGSFMCSCRSGFDLDIDGRSCTDIDECSTNSDNCEQRCINTEGSFTCNCNSGYSLSSDGRTCEDIMECSTNNGGCDHICTESEGSFQCSCRSGFELGSDGRSCTDIDECSTNSDNCEQMCINTEGSFTCGCNSGLTLNSDGRTCADIMECSTNNGGCDHICTESEGSFQCSCRSGFDLGSDGKSCTDIDECSVGSDNCEQRCINTEGSFTCGCNSGLTLNSDGRTCDDIMECSTNNGGCDHICTESEGSFQCSCRSGFDLGSDGKSCTDIDECSTNSDNCEQRCINTEGSFTCGCNSGLTLNSDGRTCADIMECSTNNGGCDHICTESEGSFQCSCRSGFDLGSDGRSCTDVDECSVGSDNCEQRCINIEGSFQCSCDRGYALDNNGITCNDINECATSNGGCSQLCTNTAGSYECGCTSGYALSANGRTCNDINECSSNNGGCSQTCTNTAGSFRCGCRSGYRLAPSDGKSCLDIDECRIGLHNCVHTCINNQGSYTCECEKGFTLNEDGRSCSFQRAIAPPMLRDVFSFCSVVAWRRPSEQCNITITGYEVLFTIPGVLPVVIRRVANGNQFHYNVIDKDFQGNPTDTLVRVRAVSSITVGEWSDVISLGCDDSCAPDTSDNNDGSSSVDDSSVSLYFNGEPIKNGSYIPLTSVGEGSKAVMCVTNKKECCYTRPHRFGEFYYPNGVQVPRRKLFHGFYRDRGDQFIRLNRRSGVTHPRGWYRCEIPDANGHIQKLFVNLK